MSVDEMVIDTYGQGATGSTPYDPTVFDNANEPYSKDKSSSAEKEDKDVFTYAHARIGHLESSGIDTPAIGTDADVAPEYYNLQGVRIANPTPGQLYIKRQGAKVSKHIAR